jgi:hypothetical protein
MLYSFFPFPYPRSVNICADLDPDPSINKQKVERNLNFKCFVTFLFLKTDVNVPTVT